MFRSLFFTLSIATVIFFQACFSPKKNNEINPEKAKAVLLQADMDFSLLSAKKGMKHAFLEYIDSNGILLRPGILPISGADAVDYLIAQNDTGYILSRTPKNAEVSLSGEMGYTFGSYEVRPKIKDTVLYGTYVSIWKKQADGKWKFVLDTGNEGTTGEKINQNE